MHPTHAHHPEREGAAASPSLACLGCTASICGGGHSPTGDAAAVGWPPGQCWQVPVGLLPPRTARSLPGRRTQPTLPLLREPGLGALMSSLGPADRAGAVSLPHRRPQERTAAVSAGPSTPCRSPLRGTPMALLPPNWSPTWGWCLPASSPPHKPVCAPLEPPLCSGRPESCLPTAGHSEMDDARHDLPCPGTARLLPGPSPRRHPGSIWDIPSSWGARR